MMLCEKMMPPEANARYVLGILSSDAVVDLANEWLEAGLYSSSLGELCTVTAPVMSDVGPLFVSAMRELGVVSPTKIEAARLLVWTTLERVSTGCSNPVEEAEFLYWDVHHALASELPDKTYVGDNLGLENVFCWLREIWDCRDGSMLLYHADLPRDLAEKKFVEHLREASTRWISDNTQQAGGTDALPPVAHP